MCGNWLTASVIVSTGGIYMSTTNLQTFDLKLLIQGHPQSAKVPHVEDFKSTYISLIIGPRCLQCETNL